MLHGDGNYVSPRDERRASSPARPVLRGPHPHPGQSVSQSVANPPISHVSLSVFSMASPNLPVVGPILVFIACVGRRH